MGSVKLVAPFLRIIREGHDPLEIQCDNRDLLNWERTRLRAKPVWPTMQDGPFKWMTFLGWSAARRDGAIPADLTYEAWENEVRDVRDAGQDGTSEDDGVPGAPSELGTPTVPGLEPG